MALRVIRPSSGHPRVTVFTDERDPSMTFGATLYCKQHGHEVIGSLLDVLVDLDD